VMIPPLTTASPTAQAEARSELAASKSMAVKSRPGVVSMRAMCAARGPKLPSFPQCICSDTHVP
jgi:hypothetical protein